MLPTIIAEAVAAGVTGSFTLGVAGAGSAIGIGLIGARMVEAIGRKVIAFQVAGGEPVGPARRFTPIGTSPAGRVVSVKGRE